MITKKTKYALKALQYLCQRCGRGPVLISEISSKERIPKKFLELILLELKNVGILQSKKGKQGGYFLAKPSAEVRMSEILRALEGPLAPMPCLSKTEHAPCDDCLDENTCAIKKIFKEAYEAQIQHLEKSTLKDLSDFCDQANRVPTYQI
jgi:Rrf2 family protein